MPIYSRGNGRYERWRGGIKLNFPGKKYEGCLQTEIAGAAVFDNPDRFNFAVRLDRIKNLGTKNKLIFGILHTDAYALNALPIPDPLARRPTSSVNATWAEIGWRASRPRFGTEAFPLRLEGKTAAFFRILYRSL